MEKIYIAGCGGMLGEGFYTQFKNYYTLKCSDIDVNEKWLSYNDFCNREEYERDVFNFKPDYLFHLGAYTDLEYCEKNPVDAHKTNTLAVENAVHIANKLNIPILYISTAGIFDGKKEFYYEWDEPNPLCIYAQTKYLGERYVIENADKYLICRAGWMMGAGAKKDKKFIQKLMKQIKDGADKLYIVNDRQGTPTYTHDFAKNVKLLIEFNQYGLFNMVCSGETSRIEIAEELLKILHLYNKLKIEEVSSDYFKDIYFAQRPPNESLINKKLDLLHLNRMRNWKIALDEYIHNYYKDYLD